MKACKLLPDKCYRNSHGAVRRITHASDSLTRYTVIIAGPKASADFEKEGSTRTVTINKFLNWATSEIIM